jgi:hypothetical protein
MPRSTSGRAAWPGAHQEAGARPLRVVHDTGPVDLEGAKATAEAFLTALGLRLDAEGLADTPAEWRAPTRSSSPGRST